MARRRWCTSQLQHLDVSGIWRYESHCDIMLLGNTKPCQCRLLKSTTIQRKTDRCHLCKSSHPQAAPYRLSRWKQMRWQKRLTWEGCTMNPKTADEEPAASLAASKSCISCSRLASAPLHTRITCTMCSQLPQQTIAAVLHLAC